MSRIEQIKGSIKNGTPSTYKIINEELFKSFNANVEHDLIHDPKYNLFVGDIRVNTEFKNDRYMGTGYFKAGDLRRYGIIIIKESKDE